MNADAESEITLELFHTKNDMLLVRLAQTNKQAKTNKKSTIDVELSLIHI